MAENAENGKKAGNSENAENGKNTENAGNSETAGICEKTVFLHTSEILKIQLQIMKSLINLLLADAGENLLVIPHVGGIVKIAPAVPINLGIGPFQNIHGALQLPAGVFISRAGKEL